MVQETEEKVEVQQTEQKEKVEPTEQKEEVEPTEEKVEVNEDNDFGDIDDYKSEKLGASMLSNKEEF